MRLDSSITATFFPLSAKVTASSHPAKLPPITATRFLKGKPNISIHLISEGL
jgi:hypothetical protein